MLFLHQFDTAERSLRGETRILFRHAAPPKLLFEQRHMRGNLAGEVLLHSPGAEDVHEPQDKPPQRSHVSPRSTAAFRQDWRAVAIARSACAALGRQPS